MTKQTKKPVHRYNLGLPQELFDGLQTIANNENTTVLEVIKQFVKLGFIAYDIQHNENKALIIRDGDTEREIVLFL